MRLLLICIPLLLGLSCNNTGSQSGDQIVLEDSVMVHLLSDILIIQSALNNTPVSVRDSAAKVYENQIAEIYGYTWDDLYTYIAEEGKDLEEMDKIYSAVLKNIKAIEDESN